MRLYVSGPMTGLPEFNHPAFNAAATRLRAAGFEVVNPADLDAADAGTPMTWEQYLRRDIKALMDCDAIATLEGWQRSKGACLEVGTDGGRIRTEVVWLNPACSDAVARGDGGLFSQAVA